MPFFKHRGGCRKTLNRVGIIFKQCKIMKIKLSIVLLFFMASFFKMNAQQPADWISELSNPDADYYEIRAAAKSYLAAHPDADEERQLFNRWNTFWSSRHGDDNDPGSFHPAYMALLNSFTEIDEICEDTPENADGWSPLGPLTLPFFNVNGTTPTSGSTGNGMGWVQKVYCDPNDPSGNTVYAGSKHGGIFRTQNAMANDPDDIVWEHLTINSRIPGLGVRDIAIVPTQNGAPGDIFVVTGNSPITGNDYGVGLIKSTDNGQTWEQTPLTISASNFSVSLAVAINPTSPNEIIVGRKNKIYKSDDGGLTFNMVYELLPNNNPGGDFNGRRKILDIVFHPSNSNIVYVSCHDAGGDDGGAGFFISNDGGDSFTEITEELFSFADEPQELKVRMDIAVTAAEPDWVYVSIVYRECTDPDMDCGDGNGSNAYGLRRVIAKSENSGIDWTNMTANTQGNGIKNDLGASQVNADVLFSGEVLIRRSLDQGASFNPVSLTTLNGINNWVHDDLRDFEIITIGSDEVVYAAHDGGIARSTDNGNTWVNIFGSGLNVAQFYSIDVSTDGSTISGGNLDEGQVTSHDGQWINAERVGDAFRTEIDPYDHNIIYTQTWGGGPPRIQDSNDRGLNWSFYISGLTPETNCPMEVHEDRALYFAGTQVHRRGFNTSVTDQIGTLDGGLLYSMAVAPSDFNVIYTAKEHGVSGSNLPSANHFFKTKDADQGSNATWENITSNCMPLTHGGITDIEVHPRYSDQLWITLTRFSSGNKVFYSPDGGGSWKNVSTGLPNFPANTLAFDESTGALYVGTDVGVFVNTEPTSSSSGWQCFNKAFPPTLISDLEINYCERKLYASTFGNGVWEVDLLKLPNLPQVIDQNETWASGTKRLLNTDLVIKSGAKLRIEGEVFIADNRKIVVEPNGQLIVDQGKLSSLCNLWQGIVVIGNSAIHQQVINGVRYQGHVELVNNAIIEHAIEGVSLYDIDNPLLTSGGIVHGTSAKFINCIRAVNFQPYINFNPLNGKTTSNFSSFTDSEFSQDDAYRGTNGAFLEHILMEGVSGIRYRGCDFKNENPNLASSRGRGIRSMDAHYVVEGWCPNSTYPCSVNYQRSSFNGFLFGIVASSSGFASRSYTVDRTDFTNNLYGVLNNSVNHARITRSVFNVGGLAFDTNGNDGLGLFINTGTGFIIESNTFNGLGVNANAVGVTVKNAGGSTNQVYHNSFNSLHVGDLANGVNRDEDFSNLGLKYFCNKNKLNTFDFAVPDENSNLNGISQNQGSNTNAAGNTFSFLPVDNDGDFFNESTWTVNYWYYDQNSIEIPLDFSTLVFPIQTPNPGACKNRYQDDQPIPGEPAPEEDRFTEFEQQFNINKPIYDDLLATRANLIDGGNTSTLINTISNFQNGGAQLKSDLLAWSPYLSRTVLMATADRDDILSHTDVYDIMMANPDESRAAILINYLATKPNPLPQVMIDALRNQAFQSTARTVLESDISNHSTKVNEAIHFFINHYNSQDLKIDSLHYWLAIQEDLMADYTKIDAYLQEGDIAKANFLLGQIPQTYDLSGNQSMEYTYFQQLKQLQMDLLNQSLRLRDFNSTQVQQLLAIAESSEGLAGQQAKNILNFAYASAYEPSIILPGMANQALRISGKTEVSLNDPNMIKAFPNPATDLLTFEYRLEDLKKDAMIQVFDIHGKLIKSIPLTDIYGFVDWHTKDVESGLYIYTIGYENEILEKGQISIVK